MWSLFLRCNIAFVLCLVSACGSPPEPIQECTFAVIDVGQGLSQLITAGGVSLLADAGPPGSSEAVLSAMRAAYADSFSAIFLSHEDADHSGGLGDSLHPIPYAGDIYVHAHQDTALIRAAAAPQARAKIFFHTVSQFDTIRLLPGVEMVVLWPPDSIPDAVPITESLRNHYSMVIRLQHGAQSFLLCGDADSSALRELAALEWTLGSSLMVVPHHGSAGSVLPLFFGYARPEIAVLSYGEGNTYGHPASRMVTLLFSLGSEIRSTAPEGTLVFRSNGTYLESPP